MMQYKFKVSERTQITDTTDPELIAYIEACLAAHPLEVDEDGCLIITDEESFKQLMEHSTE